MDRIQSLKQELKVLKTLITMQLRERLDISFKGRIKKSVFKLSIYLLLFVALTAIIYLVLYLLSSLGVFGIGGYIPVSLFNVLFISLLLITTLACIDKFTNALFFSNDNQVLLTFPANEKTIFLSKVLTFLVLELIRNSFVFLPLLIAYGISTHVAWYYFLWLIPSFLIITLVPVAIASLFSTPYMYLKIVFKKIEVLRSAVFILLLLGITLALFYLVNLLPEDLQIALKWATVYYPSIINLSLLLEKYLIVFAFMSTILFGYVPGGTNNLRYLQVCSPAAILTFFVTLLVCVALVTAVSLAVKPLFIKMASSTIEFSKRSSIKPNKDYKRRPLLSLVYGEILSDVRTPSRLVSNYLLFIVSPVATLLLNAIFKAIHTSSSGQLYILAVNFLIIALITCSSNVTFASVYSREGEASLLNRTMPLPYPLVLSSKLIIRGFIMSASIILTVLVYHGKLSIAYSRMDLLIFTFLFIYWGHLFWSAELDFSNPKILLYKEIGQKGNIFNINEMLASVYGLLVAIVFALLSYVFVSESLISGYIRVFIFALLFFAGRVVLFYSKISGFKNSIGN